MSARIRRVQQLHVPATPLVARFGLFAERLEVRTNDPRVIDAAEAAFGRFDEPAAGRPLVLRLVVAETAKAAGAPSPGAPSPGALSPGGPPSGAWPLDARDLVHDTAGHLLVIGLGSEGRAAVDAERGFATGTVTAAVAGQPGLLRYAFVEAMALAMLTGGRGYLPIHASCVVRDRPGRTNGVGVILQAPAGTGKSTLAFACARRGWGLLAEDVVFARLTGGARGGGGHVDDIGGAEGSLELWGMPWTQRLLLDAPRFFPELASAPARLQANGERKLEVDLDEHAPGAAMPRATAGPVVLLVRDSGGPTRAEWLAPRRDASSETSDDAQIDAAGAASLEVEVLWPWEAGWTAAHDRTATRLLDGGLLRLHLNSTPDEAVEALDAALGLVPATAG